MSVNGLGQLFSMVPNRKAALISEKSTNVSSFSDILSDLSKNDLARIQKNKDIVVSDKEILTDLMELLSDNTLLDFESSRELLDPLPNNSDERLLVIKQVIGINESDLLQSLNSLKENYLDSSSEKFEDLVNKPSDTIEESVQVIFEILTSQPLDKQQLFMDSNFKIIVQTLKLYDLLSTQENNFNMESDVSKLLDEISTNVNQLLNESTNKKDDNNFINQKWNVMFNNRRYLEESTPYLVGNKTSNPKEKLLNEKITNLVSFINSDSLDKLEKALNVSLLTLTSNKSEQTLDQINQLFGMDAEDFVSEVSLLSEKITLKNDRFINSANNTQVVDEIINSNSEQALMSILNKLENAVFDEDLVTDNNFHKIMKTAKLYDVISNNQSNTNETNNLTEVLKTITSKIENSSKEIVPVSETVIIKQLTVPKNNHVTNKNTFESTTEVNKASQEITKHLPQLLKVVDKNEFENISLKLNIASLDINNENLSSVFEKLGINKNEFHSNVQTVLKELAINDVDTQTTATAQLEKDFIKILDYVLKEPLEKQVSYLGDNVLPLIKIAKQVQINKNLGTTFEDTSKLTSLLNNMKVNIEEVSSKMNPSLNTIKNQIPPFKGVTRNVSFSSIEMNRKQDNSKQTLIGELSQLLNILKTTDINKFGTDSLEDISFVLNKLGINKSEFQLKIQTVLDEMIINDDYSITPASRALKKDILNIIDNVQKEPKNRNISLIEKNFQQLIRISNLFNQTNLRNEQKSWNELSNKEIFNLEKIIDGSKLVEVKTYVKNSNFFNPVLKPVSTKVQDELSQTEINVENSVKSDSLVNVNANSQHLSKTEQLVLHLEKAPNSKSTEQMIKQFENILSKNHLYKTDGSQRIFIKVNPDHLGALSIELIQKDSAIVAKILTSTVNAKEILESQLSNLRQAFTTQNIQVERIEIAHQMSQNERYFNKEQNQNQQQREQHHEEQKENRKNSETSNSFADELLNIEI